MTRRLVIFDVDGTLVDSQAHILASMAGAFAALGRPAPAREEALAVVGLSLPLALGRLAPWADAAETEALVEAYKATFQAVRGADAGASPLYPGTRAMLGALAAEPGTLMGLATGKSRRGLDHVIAQHALSAFFATTQVADDHPSKPHPGMLLAALAETGVAPGAAAMVGDTAYDIEMGRAAGVRTVAVSWGYHGRERLGGADAVIDDWAALGPALAGLGASG